MDEKQRRELAESLLPATRTGGALALRLRHGDLQVRSKPDKSPVSSADIECQAYLVDVCARLHPGLAVLGEEEIGGGRSAGAFGQSAYLLLDPIDGTREYIAGRSDFTINIALVEDGRPTLGIIFAPARQRLFFGFAPGSAFEEDAFGHRRPLWCRAETIPSRPRIVASRSYMDPSTKALIAGIGPHALRRMGSSLKFAMIAAGEADLYPRLSPTMPWDSAAGQALIESAGGAVIQVDGEPLACSASGAPNTSFLAASGGPLARLAAEHARAIVESGTVAGDRGSH